MSDLHTQDYGYYAGGGGGQAATRGYHQNAPRGNDFFGEPTTPQYSSRPSSQRKNTTDESEFSPGLLDLHSFDTELLPEVCKPEGFWLNACAALAWLSISFIAY